MNHHLSTGLLTDFVHGELRPEDDAVAHAHLAVCDACRADFDRELLLTETLRRAASLEEREMPSLVNAAVWQKVREAQPGPFARLLGWLQPGIAVPVGALLIAGGIFASPLLHPSATHPRIDAAYYLEAHAAQTEQSPLSERSGPQVLEPASNDNAYRPSLVHEADLEFISAGNADEVR